MWMDSIRPSESSSTSTPPISAWISTTFPKYPRDLSALPWATRVLVYRDAVTLALADEMSPEEERYLGDLAERMGLPAETVAALFTWVRDYEALLNRLDALITV